MKIKDGFILREIADTWIVVPIAQRVVEFNGLMTLSESGVLLWNVLEKGSSEQELIAILTTEYRVDNLTAKIDVQEFVHSLNEKGLLI